MGNDLFNSRLCKFSIRKLKAGVCSVLLFTLLLLGNAAQVDADENVLPADSSAVVAEVAAPAVSQSDTFVVVSEAPAPLVSQSDTAVAVSEAPAPLVSQSDKAAAVPEVVAPLVNQSDKAAAIPENPASAVGQSDTAAAVAEVAAPLVSQTDKAVAVPEIPASAVSQSDKAVGVPENPAGEQSLESIREVGADRKEEQSSAVSEVAASSQPTVEALKEQSLQGTEVAAKLPSDQENPLTSENNTQSQALVTDQRSALSAAASKLEEALAEARLYGADKLEANQAPLEKAVKALEESSAALQNSELTEAELSALTAILERRYLSVKNAITRTNSGLRDSRNGTPMPQETDFRSAEDTESPKTNDVTEAVNQPQTPPVVADPAPAAETVPAAKPQVQQGADLANVAIAPAPEKAVVAVAQTPSQNTVGAVDLAAEAKPAAKAEVEKARQAKDAAIDARTDLTVEEKAAAKARVQKEADAANAAIDAAADNTAVTAAQTAAQNTISAIEPEAQVRQKAKSDLSQKAADQKARIAANNKLTAEEKQAAYDLIDRALAQSQKAINSAQDNAGVGQAYTKGAVAIVAAQGQAVAKPAAKAEVEKSRQAKDKVIEGRKDLTAEEKAAAKSQTKSAADAANAAIDAAADNVAVTDAQTAGQNTIAAINPTAVAKPAAKAEVEKSRQSKDATIDDRRDMTAEEKAGAKAQAQQAADAAKAAINAASNNAAVTAAQRAGQDTIEAIELAAATKPTAKAELEKSRQSKDAALDARADLTAEEKVALKSQIQQTADAANMAIDNAADETSVIAAQAAGQASIETINP